jgi:hypothetical protein
MSFDGDRCANSIDCLPTLLKISFTNWPALGPFEEFVYFRFIGLQQTVAQRFLPLFCSALSHFACNKLAPGQKLWFPRIVFIQMSRQKLPFWLFCWSPKRKNVQ